MAVSTHTHTHAQKLRTQLGPRSANFPVRLFSIRGLMIKDGSDQAAEDRGSSCEALIMHISVNSDKRGN